MDDLKMEPVRYFVRLNGKGLGVCYTVGARWCFLCHSDNSFTMGDTPDMAVARKLARMRLSQIPDGSGNK